jgi:cytochrome c oxidase cbb3-type subunit IV
MDLNDARVLITLVALVTFIGIVVWAYSSRRKQNFDKASRMALDDEEPTEPNRSDK